MSLHVCYMYVSMCVHTREYMCIENRGQHGCLFVTVPLPFCLFIQLYFLRVEDNFISGWERNNKAGKLYVSTATGRRELRRRWNHAFYIWHGGRAEWRRSCIFEFKQQHQPHQQWGQTGGFSSKDLRAVAFPLFFEIKPNQKFSLARQIGQIISGILLSRPHSTEVMGVFPSWLFTWGPGIQTQNSNITGALPNEPSPWPIDWPLLRILNLLQIMSCFIYIQVNIRE